MTLRIRKLATAALYAVSVTAVSMTVVALPAAAQSWPQKPMKYVAPFSPGGVSDGVARLIALHLSDKLGQPVVVENKPGVSGIVGTQAEARSPADGYRRSSIKTE